MTDDPLAAVEQADAIYLAALATYHAATENQTRWYDLMRGARDPAGRARLAGAIEALGLTTLDEALAVAPRLDEARTAAEAASNAASRARTAAGDAMHVADLRARQAADAAREAEVAAREADQRRALEDERQSAAEVAAWLSSPAAVRALRREMADSHILAGVIAAELRR